MEQKSFILKNEESVNKITSRILLCATLVFPAIYILTLIKVFTLEYITFLIQGLVCFICLLIPFVIRNLNFSSNVVKYFVVIMPTIAIGIAATNVDLGVYLTYFPLASVVFISTTNLHILPSDSAS